MLSNVVLDAVQCPLFCAVGLIPYCQLPSFDNQVVLESSRVVLSDGDGGRMKMYSFHHFIYQYIYLFCDLYIFLSAFLSHSMIVLLP